MYTPFPFNQYDYYRELPTAERSYIRILNASPNAPAVDVYANEYIIAKGLRYKEFSQYLPLVPGCYEIRVFPVNTITNPLTESFVCMPPRSAATIATINPFSNIDLLTIPEPAMTPVLPGKSYIRFIHLSPDAPNVDVSIGNNVTPFRDVEYREASPYVQVDPRVYNFTITPVGSTRPILYVPNAHIRPNRFYSIYLVGLQTGRPSLEALIPLDGISYLKL